MLCSLSSSFLLRSPHFFPSSFRAISFHPPWQIRSPVPSSGPPAPSGGCQAWLASDLYWADLGDISAARDVHQSAVAAAMRIRKRKSVDDAAEPPTPPLLPMCWKFQKAGEWPESVCQQVAGRSCSDAGNPTKPAAAVCKANPTEDVVKARSGDGDLAPKLQKVRGEREYYPSLPPSQSCMYDINRNV